MSLLNQALSLDAQGREALAVPLYRRAIAAKLSRTDLRHALIGLGSSLHSTGQSNAAIRTLQAARKIFPQDSAITLFLALVHQNMGQHKLALRQLGDALLKESSDRGLAPYREILRAKYHAIR